MKKIFLGLVAFGLILTPLFTAQAQAKETKDKSTVQDTDKKKVENEAKRRTELENTEWKVTLYSTKPTDRDAEEGVLVFQKETLTFKDFKKFNLEPIGYTLTAYPDNEKGTLETFKTTKDGNISIRGDWEGTIMNGIIGQQTADGKSMKILRFTSVNAVKPLAVEEKKEPGKEVAAPAASSEKALVSTGDAPSQNSNDDKSSKNDKSKKSSKLAGKLVSM